MRFWQSDEVRRCSRYSRFAEVPVASYKKGCAGLRRKSISASLKYGTEMLQ